MVPRRLRIGEAQLAKLESPSQAPNAPSLLCRCVSLFEPNRGPGPLISYCTLAKLAIALSQATDAARWCSSVCARPLKKESDCLPSGLPALHLTASTRPQTSRIFLCHTHAFFPHTRQASQSRLVDTAFANSRGNFVSFRFVFLSPHLPPTFDRT